MRASPFFFIFDADLGFLSIPLWHFGAVNSQIVLQSSPISKAHASHDLACCGGLKLPVHQGGDRSVQGSSDTNPALEAQWEQGMPGADGVTAMGMGWMQHVYAVPGEFQGTQASLQVLRERSALVVENTNTKYFGDSQQRNWVSSSLLLYLFFGCLSFGCFLFFFSPSSSLHTSVSS